MFYCRHHHHYYTQMWDFLCAKLYFSTIGAKQHANARSQDVHISNIAPNTKQIFDKKNNKINLNNLSTYFRRNITIPFHSISFVGFISIFHILSLLWLFIFIRRMSVLPVFKTVQLKMFWEHRGQFYDQLLT